MSAVQCLKVGVYLGKVSSSSSLAGVGGGRQVLCKGRLASLWVYSAEKEQVEYGRSDWSRLCKVKGFLASLKSLPPSAAPEHSKFALQKHIPQSSLQVWLFYIRNIDFSEKQTSKKAELKPLRLDKFIPASQCQNASWFILCGFHITIFCSISIQYLYNIHIQYPTVPCLGPMYKMGNRAHAS